MHGRVFVQRPVRPNAVIVACIGAQHAPQMPSPTTMMWSRHSRRMDPISRSAKPFCQGDRGAIGLSRMPIARIRWITTEPKTRSRSRITCPGAESHGNGLFVTLIQTDGGLDCTTDYGSASSPL